MKFERSKAPARGSAGWKRRAAVVSAAGIAFAGTAAMTMVGAPGAHASTTTTLTGSQEVRVANGAAGVQNNEWGSGEPESIATTGNAGFTVVNSSIANATNGAPGGYPSIYSGCHWGDCTRGGLAAHPVPVSALTTPGTVRTSWSTTQPGGNAAYDVAYDIWFNQTPTTTGQPNGAELMVWINHRGGVEPYGAKVGTADINGVSYQVWEGAQPWGDTISYVMNKPTTSVTNLDLGGLAADALQRGYIHTSWDLIDVEAGFELWQGGAGLATNSFSVNLSSSASQTPATPTAPTTPVHTPAPSPASPSAISLQAVSPQHTTPGVATNATVDFTNTGSAMASNVTMTIEVLDSAGKVVGAHSWAAQNIAPHQPMSQTYTWTAASTAGTYAIEGLQDSFGKTQKARVGTITVNPIG
ncbi:MAG: cellulose-binding, family [Actinomycetia bacterium]|nr:cellulose-binding, family [Actinomycetes bacterium]